MYLPSVAIITDNNILAIPLADKLKKLKCSVETFETVNLKKLDDKRRYDYAIFIYLNQKDIISHVKNYSSKTIFVFPYAQTENTLKLIKDLKKKFKERKEGSVSTLYLGELIGPHKNLFKNDWLNQSLVDAVIKQSVEVFKKDIVFHPISVSAAIRQIVKSLFSFGYYGKEAAIISSGLSQSKLIEILRRQIPTLVIKPNKKSEAFVLEDTQGKIVIKQNLEKEIIKALKNIANHKENFTLKTPKKTRSFKKKSISARLVRAAALSVVLIFWPTLLIFFIAFSQKVEWKLIERGNFNLAQKLFYVSKNASSQLVSYLNFLPDIPGENIFLHPIEGAARVLTRSGEIGISVARLGSMYIDLYDNAGEAEEYNLEDYAMKVSLELDYLHNELGFVETEIEELRGFSKDIFANWILFQESENPAQSYAVAGGDEAIEIVPEGHKSKQKPRVKTRGSLYENDGDLRENITQVKRIVNELPSLLGQNKDRTYLILFQNNLSIRPTGGVIVSVAFITFSKGKLSNIEVLNTEVVDTYLKGFVASPGPIAKYFGSESFNLRDSNWDPNFEGAAEQAEWFIDKEIDRQVDGTIAIDVDLVAKILLITGGVHIDKFGIDVDAKNLRQVILERSNNEIWSELLSELSESLIKLDDTKKTQLGRILVSGLEEKHFLVFLHNSYAQRSISELGWDGGLPDAGCPGNCFADWVGSVESLTNENNASAMTRRAADLNIVFEEGLVKRRYVILLENTSVPESEGRVSSLYIRIVAPEESGFSPVVVKTDEEEKEIVPEVLTINGHKEAGIFVEVEPGSRLIMQFAWESPANLNINKSGEYRLFLRKQPGILDFPTKIKVNIPEKSLTQEQILEYNTELSRDFVSRISW